jgi:limonene-1,2-epoxide hydrolase
MNTATGPAKAKKTDTLPVSPLQPPSAFAPACHTARNTLSRGVIGKNNEMTPDQLVRHFIKLIETKDLEAALLLLDEKCEYDNVPMRKVFGPDSVREGLAPFLASCSEIDWEIHHQTSSGDATSGVVMNERTDRFKMGDRWVEVPLMGIFTIANGKITLWRDYFDMAMFQKAISG